MQRIREKRQGKNLELDEIVDYLTIANGSASNRITLIKPDVSTPQVIKNS